VARWRYIKQNRSSTKKIQIEKKDLYQDISFATTIPKLKAFLIDTFMLVMPIVYIVIYLIMGDRVSFKDNLLQGWLYILIPMALTIVSFYTISGQTPGLKAYNLKIISIKTRQKPTLIQALFRFILFTINFLSIFGLFYPMLTKNRQGIHDILSRTAVVTDHPDL
jgi:uncharacterized RDD family membrane protein YckC